MLHYGHILLRESLTTVKIDKIGSEWWQNDQTLPSININLLELVSYRHKSGKTGIGLILTAEIITEDIQTW